MSKNSANFWIGILDKKLILTSAGYILWRANYRVYIIRAVGKLMESIWQFRLIYKNNEKCEKI